MRAMSTTAAGIDPGGHAGIRIANAKTFNKKEIVVELRDKLQRVAVLKEKLADTRDKLRAEIADIEDILTSMDEADAELDNGLDQLSSALETMSQFV